MKEINSKKYLSLVLSIILILSNVQISAQEMLVPDVTKEIKLTELQREIEEISSKVKKMEKMLNGLSKELKEAPHYFEYLASYDFPHDEMKAFNMWKEVVNSPESIYFKKFEAYKREMKNFIKEYSSLSAKINYAEKYVQGESSKKIIERFGYKYSGKAPIVYPQKMVFEDEVMIKYFEDMFATLTPSDLIKFQSKMEDINKYFSTKFMFEDITKFERTAHAAVLVNRRADIFITDILTPQEVMKYAYEHFDEAQRSALKIALESTREEATLLSTVRKIRKYIRTFGTDSLKNISFFQLLKNLRSLDEAARVKYIQEITGFSEGQSKFLADVSKLQNSEKFVKNVVLYAPETEKVAGKIIKRGLTNGILIGIGSVFVITTINSINANNSFADSFDAATVKGKIEQSISTPEEDLLFYAGEEAESDILNNSLHTLKFIETALMLMETKSISQSIIKNEKKNIEIEDKVINGIYKNIEKLENLNKST